jgi:hypothetical protein
MKAYGVTSINTQSDIVTQQCDAEASALYRSHQRAAYFTGTRSKLVFIKPILPVTRTAKQVGV